MSHAARNRRIKAVLEQEFGRGKIRVKGDRGTAYGWVEVLVDSPGPDHPDQNQLYDKIVGLIDANNIELDRYYGDSGEWHNAINVYLRDFAREKTDRDFWNSLKAQGLSSADIIDRILHQ